MVGADARAGGVVTSAREEVLGRIRRALAAAPVPTESLEPVAGPELSREEVLDLFVERTADYQAEVVRCTTADLPARVLAALGDAQVVVEPSGLDPSWTSAVDGARLVVDDGVPAAELDHIEAVVTAAACGIADNGTVVLDHAADQGRRAITLVPDRHVCVVRASQVVPDVTEAIEALRPAVDAHRPLTWIAGPSATSDIELTRVEGVHGPRDLVVLLVEDA